MVGPKVSTDYVNSCWPLADGYYIPSQSDIVNRLQEDIRKYMISDEFLLL